MVFRFVHLTHHCIDACIVVYCFEESCKVDMIPIPSTVLYIEMHRVDCLVEKMKNKNEQRVFLQKESYKIVDITILYNFVGCYDRRDCEPFTLPQHFLVKLLFTRNMELQMLPVLKLTIDSQINNAGNTPYTSH